jgi:hypothetical protein
MDKLAFGVARGDGVGVVRRGEPNLGVVFRDTAVRGFFLRLPLYLSILDSVSLLNLGLLDLGLRIGSLEIRHFFGVAGAETGGHGFLGSPKGSSKMVQLV